MRKYHWPGSIPPSPLSLLCDFEKTLHGKFTIDSVQDFGPRMSLHYCLAPVRLTFAPADYPRCLREWGRRLEEHWDAELIEELQTRYPEMKDEKILEMFHRRCVLSGDLSFCY